MNVSISVIVPVHNGRDLIRTCLEHLRQSTVSALECIVVDDHSVDGSADVARELGAKVITTPKRRGPALARNIAAAEARGDILLFLDADVAVHPDVLERVRRAFAGDPSLDALIGAYDDAPAQNDFLSQYRNLMHCFVHEQGRRDASTFWTGCGATRREVFLAAGGFSESYGRPSIEDIELGYRLKQNGRRILLDPTLKVKHLKRWTLWSIVSTDVLDRGIPWTELILRDRSMPDDLNLKMSQRASVALVYITLAIAVACAVHWRGLFLAPLFAVLFFVLGRYWMDPFSKKSWPVRLITTALFASILATAWFAHLRGLIPLVLTGAAALLVQHRVRRDASDWVRLLSVLVVVLCLLTILVLYVPQHPLLAALALPLIVLIVLNSRFYFFLAGRKGKSFALAAIPLHLLYHLYNGVSFLTGALLYLARRQTART